MAESNKELCFTLCIANNAERFNYPSINRIFVLSLFFLPFYYDVSLVTQVNAMYIFSAYVCVCLLINVFKHAVNIVKTTDYRLGASRKLGRHVRPTI